MFNLCNWFPYSHFVKKISEHENPQSEICDSTFFCSLRRKGLRVKKTATSKYPKNVVTKPYKKFEYDEEDDVVVKTLEGRTKQRQKWELALEKQERRARELIRGRRQ